MILTDTKGTGHMVLTPSYYVFKMYRDFQEATHLPIDVKTDSISVEGGHMHNMVDGKIPAVSISAAKKQDGGIVIALANTSLDKAQTVELNLQGQHVKTLSGNVLTAKSVKGIQRLRAPRPRAAGRLQGGKLKKVVATLSCRP